MLGAKIRVPTPIGTVAATIPKWSSTGRVLRLKGRGVPRPDGGKGDQYVTLRLMLPQKPDPTLEAFIAQWQPAAVRAGLAAENLRENIFSPGEIAEIGKTGVARVG